MRSRKPRKASRSGDSQADGAKKRGHVEGPAFLADGPSTANLSASHIRKAALLTLNCGHESVMSSGNFDLLEFRPCWSKPRVQFIPNPHQPRRHDAAAVRRASDAAAAIKLGAEAGLVIDRSRKRLSQVEGFAFAAAGACDHHLASMPRNHLRHSMLALLRPVAAMTSSTERVRSKASSSAVHRTPRPTVTNPSTRRRS